MECYPNGRNSPQAGVCVAKRVTSYPTWIINGQRHAGILSPERLAQITQMPPFER